jgi:hypothetical protein
MRIEQIIAAVTRSVVNSTVREIKAAGLFAGALRLHLRPERMHLGMLAYSQALPALPIDGGNLGMVFGNPGSTQGRWQLQPVLALACCPAGRAKA